LSGLRSFTTINMSLSVRRPKYIWKIFKS